jgi:hypothetical protein
MLVGDLLLVSRKVFRVTGIYLGSVGVQNLVGLVPYSSKFGSAHGKRVTEMLVPEELTTSASLYRPVQKERPTLGELESLLNSDEDYPITIGPDGSVSAG